MELFLCIFLDFGMTQKLLSPSIGTGVDSCSPDPCQNEGQCISSPSQHKSRPNICRCSGHFTGKCSSDKNFSEHTYIVNLNIFNNFLMYVNKLKVLISEICTYINYLRDILHYIHNSMQVHFSKLKDSIFQDHYVH